MRPYFRNLYRDFEFKLTVNRSMTRVYFCCLPILLSLLGLLVALQTFSAYAQEPTTSPAKRLTLHADSSEYPKVKISLALLGVDPEFMLYPTDYDITGTGVIVVPEDDRVVLSPIPTEYDQPINLVLALDCSVTDEKDWMAVRQAAFEVLNHLTPEDEVLVIAYGAQVEILLGWVKGSDIALVQSEIEQIVPQYTRTAFNEALDEAMKLADEKGERSTVLMIADRTDNTFQPSITHQDLITALGTKRIPLYIYGYGEKAQANRNLFADYTRASGGFLKVVDQSSQLTSEMASLLDALHRRFIITSQFSIPVDDQRHDYAIQVRYGSERITATDKFQAERKKLQLALHGLTTDALVFGKLELSTTVKFSPMAPVSITYYLNDQQWGPVAYQDHTLQWDLDADIEKKASFASNRYTVTVKVQDILGNTGQETDHFRVAQPLTGTLLISPAIEVKVGDNLAPHIRASSEFTLQQVILVVNQQQILNDTKPYSTVLDIQGLQLKTISETYPFTITALKPGAYSLTMSIMDVAGRKLPNQSTEFVVRDFTEWEKVQRAIAELSLRQRWLIASGVFGGLIGLLCLWALVALLMRRYRNARVATYWLKVANEGNMPSHYQFWAVEANSNLLDFAFDWEETMPIEQAQRSQTPMLPAQNGSAPPSISIRKEDRGNSTVAEGDAMQSRVSGNQTASSSTSMLPTFSSQKQQATRLLDLSKSAAEFFNLISKLPGPLSEPARRVAAQLRTGMNRVGQAERSVQQVTTTVGKVGEKASSFGPVSRPTTAPTPVTASKEPAPRRDGGVNAKPIRKEFVVQTSTGSAPNRHLELHQSTPEHGITHLEIGAGQDGWWRHVLQLQPGESKAVAVQLYLRRGRWRNRRYQFAIHVRNVQEKSLAQPIRETVRLGGFRVPTRIIK